MIEHVHRCQNDSSDLETVSQDISFHHWETNSKVVSSAPLMQLFLALSFHSKFGRKTVTEAGLTVLQLLKESSNPGFKSALMSGLGLSFVPLFLFYI